MHRCCCNKKMLYWLMKKKIEGLSSYSLSKSHECPISHVVTAICLRWIDRGSNPVPSNVNSQSSSLQCFFLGCIQPGSTQFSDFFCSFNDWMVSKSVITGHESSQNLTKKIKIEALNKWINHFVQGGQGVSDHLFNMFTPYLWTDL